MDVGDQMKARLEQTNPRMFEGASDKGILYPELSWEVVGAAIEVHRHIGPGQLESVYQHSMEYELRRRALAVRAGSDVLQGRSRR